MSRAFGAMVVVAAVLAVASGCTADVPVEPSPSASTPAEPIELPATDWLRVDRDEVADGGDLRLAVPALPTNYNPYLADGLAPGARDVIGPTTGGPLVFDESGATIVDEDYATSVEVTSQAPLVVEARLNPDAVWEDGTPITVRDYIATWQALNGADPAYRPASTPGYESVGSVAEGEDEYHLVMTFAAPYADWPALLTGVLKASIADDPAVFNEGFVERGMPSSGPFVVTGIDVAGQVVTLERNPLWWGETPKLDRILFRAVNEDGLGSSFSGDEIDAMRISSNPDLAEAAESVDGAAIQMARGGGWTNVILNTGAGPLADSSVREALAAMIDREQIADVADAGLGLAAVAQGSFIFSPDQDGYVDDAPAHDPDAGANLLTAAGYSKEEDSWVKDGEALELTLTVPADSATEQRRAEQIRDQLGEFGIPVEIASAPAATFFRDTVIAGDFEMATFSRAGSPFPISSSEAFFPLASASDFTGTTDAALGELYDRAAAEVDAAARTEIANDIDRAIWAYVPMLPLATIPNVWAVREGLVGYGAAEYESIDWTSVGWIAA